LDAPSPPERAPQFEIAASRQFTAWLHEQQLSLGFTTYQAGLLFLVGLQPDGRLRLFNRMFPRCMGLWSDGESMWMSSLFQLWFLSNALAKGERRDGYDRCFLPRIAHTTGDLDIHDIAVDASGRVVFVNTLYSCLATVSERHSFRPLWKPPFISKLAAEDRCHLNGMAMDGGQPRYVTAVSCSDGPAGWQARRGAGGCVIDVASGNIVTAELSMPHSPRVHDGRLWLLNSGTGFFGCVDVASGHFEEVAFCPGYLRGLSFHRGFAVVGASKCRRERSFSGLALDGHLTSRDLDARCGLFVIDLKSGDIVHWLHIDGDIEELYDVIVLPDAVQPMAMGLRTDEIRRLITIDPSWG
jgi:uncharacterized protein (TIGR03032 family)